RRVMARINRANSARHAGRIAFGRTTDVSKLFLMAKKETSLDRVLGRIESLDTINLTNLAQKLARERAYLETIFNTALEGILVVDQDGIIEYANESSRRMIGIPRDELGTIALWRLIPGLRSS